MLLRRYYNWKAKRKNWCIFVVSTVYLFIVLDDRDSKSSPISGCHFVFLCSEIKENNSFTRLGWNLKLSWNKIKRKGALLDFFVEEWCSPYGNVHTLYFPCDVWNRKWKCESKQTMETAPCRKNFNMAWGQGLRKKHFSATKLNFPWRGFKSYMMFWTFV